jgi:hypothetical protein
MPPKTCARCGDGPLRRVNRKGWLERVLLPKLGFFPWECVQCRTRRFVRDSGEGPAKRKPLEE